MVHFGVKSITLMLMKRSNSRVLAALAVYLFAMVASLLVPLFAQPAQAATVERDWVMVFPTDREVLAEMNRELSTGVTSQPGFSPGLSQTYVMHKNDLWDPAGFRKFSFNRAASDQANFRFYAFTTSYYCANDKVVKSKPSSGDYSFVELKLNAVIKAGFASTPPPTHDTTLTVKRFTHYNSAGTGVDYEVGNKTKTGTLQQVARHRSCMPGETVFSPTSSASDLFAIRNIKDPAVNDSTWANAKDKVRDQVEADPITGSDPSAGGGGSTGSTGADTDQGDQCPRKAFNFGWLICPALELVNNLFVQNFQKFMAGALSIDPLDQNGADKNIYLVWKNLRDLANVLFLLIFMIIVLANTLSINVQTYTIKKMIPKLVAAAILVQFSFIISAVIIDVGNILGDGIGDLIKSVANTPGGTNDKAIDGFFQNSAAAITAVVGGGLIVGSAIATSGATVGVAIGAIILVGITAFFAFLSILLTLVLRKMIIIILIIVSPLAFAAMVLPSTDKFFKIWLETFIKVIMMYPIIVFMFGAATVLQKAVSGGEGGVGDDAGLVKIMAAAMPIVACFMVPKAFAWGGKLMSGGSNAIDSLVRGKIGGKATAKFKASDAYTVPRALREGNKQEKTEGHAGLDGKDPLSRYRRYKAGVKLRGDYLGGNRTIAKGADGKYWHIDPDTGKRTLNKYGDMSRMQTKQRNAYLQKGIDANKELDRNEILGLLDPMRQGAQHGDFKDIKENPLLYDQMVNGIGSYIEKEGKLPYAEALDDLADLGHALGKGSEKIGMDRDFLMSRDHKVAEAHPVSSEGAQVMPTAQRVELNDDGTTKVANKEFHGVEGSEAKKATVFKEGSHAHEDIKRKFGAETFMGDNHEQAVDQLAHNYVQTSSGEQQRLLDHLLADDNNKFVLHNLRTTPTAYRNVKPETAAAVVSHANKSLARLGHLKSTGPSNDQERAELALLTKNESSYIVASHFQDDLTQYNDEAGKTGSKLNLALEDLRS